MIHRGGLFRAVLQVAPSGDVMMLEDEPLGRIVPLQ
jgi:hypothetical protein